MYFNLTFGYSEIALLCGILLLCAGLSWYYFQSYLPVSRIRPAEISDTKKPVSIVLSGKNQSEALRKNLVFWLEQKYPDFEVVVVYENSDEEVSDLLSDLSRRYKHLKLIHANQSINFFDEQKFSLSIGVKSAEHDMVILTHARFRPTSEHCIDYLQSAFGKDTKVVVGTARSSLIQKICSLTGFLEFEQTTRYLSAITSGQPLTARRDLIAYDKDFFLEHHGYTDTYALDSGSFDKLYPLIRHKKELSIQIHPGSEVQYSYPFSLTDAVRSEQQYKNTLQSIHHPSKLIFTASHWMNLFFFGFLAWGIIHFFQTCFSKISQEIPLWFTIFFLLVAVKYTIQSVLIQKAARKLQYGQLWFMLPMYEILYLPLCFSLKIGAGRKRGKP